MAYLDIPALGAVLKQKYNKKKVASIGYEAGPFFSMLKKIDDFGGLTLRLATKFGRPVGRSHSSQQADSDLTPSSYEAFTLERAKDYGAFGFTEEAIRASKGDMNAMIEGQSTEIEGALENLKLNMCQELFRNGGTARARGSTTSTVTNTLTQAADTAQFEYGMTVVTSTADGTSGSVKAGSVQIVGIDRDAGTITANVAWSTGIPTYAQTDYVFQAGDFGQGLKGLLAWLPTTAPVAGTLFFGADRAKDATRLGGVRISGGGGPIEETLIEAQARLSRERSRADACFMNPLDWAQFAKAISGKVYYDRGKRESFDDPSIGFDSIKVVGPTGPMDILPDVFCPKGNAFMLQMNTWEFHHLGDAPGILDSDGNVFRQVPGTDFFKGLVCYYGQLGCTAPGYNAVITL